MKNGTRLALSQKGYVETPIKSQPLRDQSSNIGFVIERYDFMRPRSMASASSFIERSEGSSKTAFTITITLSFHKRINTDKFHRQSYKCFLIISSLSSPITTWLSEIPLYLLFSLSQTHWGILSMPCHANANVNDYTITNPLTFSATQIQARQSKQEKS